MFCILVNPPLTDVDGNAQENPPEHRMVAENSHLIQSCFMQPGIGMQLMQAISCIGMQLMQVKSSLTALPCGVRTCIAVKK